MQQATSATSVTPLTRLFDRARLELVADGLAVALAVSLPWSTSATGILVALWFIAVLPTLDFSRLREVALTPAGGTAIAFAALALLGILWSQVPVAERFAGLVPYARMLAIPLLMVQFSRSSRGAWVFYGLIASCTALLVASYWSFVSGDSGWYPFFTRQHGVPVKDYIVQSGFFTLCAFVLFEMAIGHWSEQRKRLAVALAILGLIFLINIVVVATGRTAILVIVVLLVPFALRRLTWRGRAAAMAAGLVFAGLAWKSSDYLRFRVTNVIVEVQEYETQRKPTSSGQRIEMWSNAVKLIGRAPLIGTGTGSLTGEFKATTHTDQTVIPNADNPHNQTFAVAVQLGVVGVIVLYAMWLSHLLLFRGSGWEPWVGLVMVLQIAIGSLVNSYLFDFTPGWTYAVCVGVAGGIMLRRRAAPQNP